MLTPWSLPGPLKYLGIISEHISQGRCIAVARPTSIDMGWETALDRAISDSGRFLYRVPDDHLNIEDPQRMIERLILKKDGGPVLDGRNFVAACGVAAEQQMLPVLSIAFSDERLFRKWSDHVELLERWQRIALERDRLIVLLERTGLPGEIPGRKDPIYVNLGWPWPFEEMDMAVWSHVCRQETKGVCGRLSVILASTLAGYDPELCLRLAEQDLDALLEPLPILKEYAQHRGWDSQTPSNPWIGTQGFLNGRPIPHAAWEAVKAPREPDYLRRIWSAQISVVLPEIEEMRRKFIRKHEKSLILPWVAKDERDTISLPSECEVGHLYAMVCGSRHNGRKMFVPQEDFDWIKCLWKCRNQHSHLEPLNREMIDQIDCYSKKSWDSAYR